MKDLLLLGGGMWLGGCATVLHPERQGNDSGPIDVGALILDILWFLPGIIPGIIALTVDFGTGAIYVCDRQHANGKQCLAVRHGERMTLRAPRLPAGADEHDVSLRLWSERGAVVSETRGCFGPTCHDDLVIGFDSHRADHEGIGRLELQVHGHRSTLTAVHPLRLGLPARSYGLVRSPSG